MSEISAEAAAAIEELLAMNPQWTIQDFGGQFRLERSDGTSTYLCTITDGHWRGYNAACLKGLAMAKALLADEAERVKLPRPTFGAPTSRANG